MAGLLASCSAPPARGPVVMAAASLQEVLEDAADDWVAAGHARPVLSFGGTPSLARQVQAGAPADIFVSADQQWMDWLAARDLVRPSSRRNMAANALVFIAPQPFANASRPLDRAFLQGSGHIALADPDNVPAGRYAKAALQAAGLWDAVSVKVIPTENVRAALALVERGEAELGVVYASDAQASALVAAAPLALPEGLTITYPAALLTTSVHAEAAAFLDYLASDGAAANFCAHGFTMPLGRSPC